MVNNKKISDKGIDRLVELEDEFLTAYLDVAGVWTIGVGHTGTVDGMAIKKGMTITGFKSRELLKQDLRHAENAVNKFVTVELNQKQFEALVFFVFNVGVTAFKNSTMLKRLNDGDKKGMVEAWNWWVKITKNGNRVISRGLVNRRASEIKWYLT